MFGSLRAAVESARRHQHLYFASLLPSQVINTALGEARAEFQGWIYTPAVTVWSFLSQCLSADHSCRETVARMIAWRVGRGERACSAETGAYCTARAKLPEETCRELQRATGRQAEQESPDAWKWKGRNVKLVDGSTITMPDTPENQAEYPQTPVQKPGCGFPIARILVVFSLAVGTVFEAAIGRYQGKQTGEGSLFRGLFERFESGDVILGDRCFSGWFDLALMRERQLDAVVRKHHLRATDFRTGERLGFDDHVVTWLKPVCPEWMDQETYDRLPAELRLREVRVRVEQRGFRSKEVLVITTLLDPEEYSAADLAELYRRRWQAELNLRSLKTVLQMDHLRCRTPERVRNEFFMHLTAYNLLRQVIGLAAYQAGVEPWQISFKGAMQTLNAFLPLLPTTPSVADWLNALVASIAAHEVGNRPDRFEPRCKKRRPKPYQLLSKPRHMYKPKAA